jgi:hypothetical protein
MYIYGDEAVGEDRGSHEGESVSSSFFGPRDGASSDGMTTVQQNLLFGLLEGVSQRSSGTYFAAWHRRVVLFGR